MVHIDHTRAVAVGVDGSVSSLQAVRWAAKVAHQRKVPLRLVHAFEVPVGYPPGLADPALVRSAMQEQGRRWLREALDAVAEVAPELRPDAVLELAPTVPALLKETVDASLLVLGTRGLGGFTGLLVGSTAVALASHGHCPVVVVRTPAAGQAPPTSGPVVVGVDGTPAGESAIELAFEEASRRGTDLVALHAWPDSLMETVLETAETVLDVEPIQQRAYEVLAERLAGWPEKFPDVRITREVVRDRPTRALLRAAQPAQLVVVGSRGRGGFTGLLLGSTSQHLLHHAPCPVAVVRTRTVD